MPQKLHLDMAYHCFGPLLNKMTTTKVPAFHVISEELLLLRVEECSALRGRVKEIEKSKTQTVEPLESVLVFV